MKPKRGQIPPDVRKAIREAYGDGSKVSLIDVALQFGFAISTIGAIVNNHTRARALEDEAKPQPGRELK